MGLSGINIWSLIIILAIIVLLFGTKRLRNVGEDIGAALRGFRKGIKETEEAIKDTEKPQNNTKEKTEE